MAVLDKAAFLNAAAQPLPIERVEVPELGGHVFIRGMSGVERDAWEKTLLVGRGKSQKVNTENVRAKLVARTAVDENRERIFSDEDAQALGALRVDVLTRLFQVAQRMSGVTDEDVEELGKVSAPEDGSGPRTS